MANQRNPRYDGIAIALMACFLASIAVRMPSSIGGSDVEAVTVNANVTIGGVAPNVASIYCCFKDYDAGTYIISDCRDAGSQTPYTPSGGKSHDLLCNFTVSDANGWQDMSDGWVNMTWFHGSVAWNSGSSNDKLYINSSCASRTPPGEGIEIVYICSINDIKYWADGGNWSAVINLSDGTIAGNPGTGDFIMGNVTSIWESSSIFFGSMLPGDTGSQYAPDVVSINATTNNTGNTVINIRVDGGSDYMNCTVGAIPVGNIKYDVSNGTAYASACGTLTSSVQWSGGCSQFNLGDCSGTCLASTYNTIKSSYWGISIPASGVGGTCNRPIVVTGAQANP